MKAKYLLKMLARSCWVKLQYTFDIVHIIRSPRYPPPSAHYGGSEAMSSCGKTLLVSIPIEFIRQCNEPKTHTVTKHSPPNRLYLNLLTLHACIPTPPSNSISS